MKRYPCTPTRSALVSLIAAATSLAAIPSSEAQTIALIRAAANAMVAPTNTTSQPSPQSIAIPQLRARQIKVLELPDGLPEVFDVPTTLDDQAVTLHLSRHNLRSPSMQLLVDHGGGNVESMPLPPARTYRGTISGEPGSAVAASLVDGGLVAIVERADGSRWHVEPLVNLVGIPAGGAPLAPTGAHVSYRAVDVNRSGGVCGNDFVDLAKPEQSRTPASKDDAEGQDGEGGVAGGTKFLAEIAFDADFEFFQKNSSSVTATVNDIETVMNQVEFIYDRDVDINYEFVAFIVRDTASDPYTTTVAGDLLCEFRTTWNASPENQIQREVAHLFTGKNLNGSVIGIAWTGVTCNASGVDCGVNGNLAYSLVESKFSGVTFNERIALSCHELGHNWGALHCDGQGDCHIMCSGLGGCDGLGGTNLKFGAPEQADIVAYRNSVSCDLALAAPLTVPFAELWTTASVSTTKWVFSNGGATSTVATNEPSAPNSLNLDATGSGLYDDDEVRSHFFLLASIPQALKLSYFTEHKGVENGEKLFVDYFNSAGDWINLNTITSNGTDETAFVPWTHNLSADAKHDQFRIRFRTDVNETNDDWYIDDIKVDFVPGPANDECSGAAAITQSVTPFDNTNATTSLPGAPASCSESNGTTLVNDLWYTHVATCTGTLTVSTCGLTLVNTRLIVYPGNTCPSAATVPLGCDDDTVNCGFGSSFVQIPVTTGQLVFIRLGVISGFGTGSLLVACSPSCPDSDGDGVCDANDNCPNTPNASQANADGDSVGDACDGCPTDPNKIAPGTCGCGIADTDSDGDGTPNCIDGCPNDPNKTTPGACGCGVPNTDSDGDGTPNCIDGCPSDPNKIAPGTCGCGVADTDSDGDGTPNCNDLCPTDPNKIAPGTCGCGVADTDSDGDGTPNCNDLCPTDPNKIAPGTCGCGVADTDSDGDGTANCNDLCPTDPNKIAPGTCGCGVADTDSDGDGTANCNDLCPTDPNKIAPGTCGCGVADTDSDGDGTADCNDGCPNDPNKVSPGPCGCGSEEVDTDGDGTPDCNDLCATDPLKTDPGLCGCGVADTDTDGDGTPDCNERPCDIVIADQPDDLAVVACDDAAFAVGVVDAGPFTYQWRRNGRALTDGDRITGSATANLVIAPALRADAGLYDVLVSDGCTSTLSNTASLTVEPVGECTCLRLATDSDGDGVDDCNDGCPTDPAKIDPGVCGCGVSDVDSDGDGVADCIDVCPGFDDGVDTDGDGIPDGCDAPKCPADFDGDGNVGGSDLAVLLGSWGACVGCAADFNGDGVVDGAELGVLLGSWGPC